MNDSKNKDTDDILSLDDIDDDIDDLDDSDWNDLEDNEEHSAPVPGARSKSQQTFVQKYFYGIVAAVIAGALGLIILGQSLLTTPSQTNAPTQEASTPAADEISNGPASDEQAMPPMPVPLDSSASSDVSEAPPVADIQAEPVQAAEMPADEPVPSLTPMPEINTTETLAAEPELADDAAPMQIPDEQVPEEAKSEPLKAESLAPSDTSIDMSAVESKIEKSNQKLSEELSALSQSTNEKILNLTASLESLQKQIQDLSSQLESSQANAVAAQAAQKEEVKPDLAEILVKQEPTQEKPEVKPEIKKEAPKKPKVDPVKSTASDKPATRAQWIMRSAQPGKALVSLKGSQDLFSVSVGDNLSGIGKVISIQQENGRWIIRGTDGMVSQ